MRTFTARQAPESQKHSTIAPRPFAAPALHADVPAKLVADRPLPSRSALPAEGYGRAAGPQLPVQAPLQLAHLKYSDPKRNRQGTRLRRTQPRHTPDVVAAADVGRVQGPLTLEESRLPFPQRKDVITAVNRRRRAPRVNRPVPKDQEPEQKQEERKEQGKEEEKSSEGSQAIRSPSLAASAKPSLPPRSVEERRAIASRTSRRMAQLHPRAAASPVTVSHREDAFGTGAFWDHYTMQTQTQRSTHVTHQAGMAPVIVPQGPKTPGKRNGHNFTGPLPKGDPASAAGVEGGFGRGLLYIPGGNTGLPGEKPSPDPAHDPAKQSASSKARNDARMKHQEQAVADARMKGRPTLAVCGGSWCLLNSFGGSTRRVEPRTHQTRSMPFLNKDGTVAKKISHHGATIAPKSMVGAFMRGRGQDPLPTRVNSAHWAAAEQTTDGRLKGVPSADSPAPKRLGNTRFMLRGPSDPQKSLLSVSAQGHTERDPPHMYNKGEPNTGHPSSVEAFETRFGAPMLGVQWHPEAYDSGSDASEHAANRRLLTSMAQAGDAYDARRAMTKQFQGLMDQKISRLGRRSAGSTSSPSYKESGGAKPSKPLVLLSPSEVKGSSASASRPLAPQQGLGDRMENETASSSSSTSFGLHLQQSTTMTGPNSKEEEEF